MPWDEDVYTFTGAHVEMDVPLSSIIYIYIIYSIS